MQKKTGRVLLVDEDVERWYRSNARGSLITADVGLRRLGRACQLLGSDPKALVEAARGDLKAFTDGVDDLVTGMEADEYSPGYISGIVKAIKSWLRYNDVEIIRRITISNVRSTPTIEDEMIPSKEELGRIFRISPPRVRVVEAFMALADLRPQVLGDYKGADGLMMKDLPELKVEDGKVVFEAIPTRVNVRAPLSKAKHKYFTFLIEEGCTYLAEYLESRVIGGETLTPDTPVIGHKRRRLTDNPFVRTTKLSNLMRKSMNEAGVMSRPYVLRCYAETQLIIAESKGKISHPFVLFHAGHTGDIASRYSVNKGRLPPDMVEDMRKAYGACGPYLSTVAEPLEKAPIIKEAKLEALKSIAKNLLGLDLIDVKVAMERESGEEMGVDEEITLFENEIKKRRQGTNNQTIVDEDDLENHLSQGYEFVSVLSPGRVIIRRN